MAEQKTIPTGDDVRAYLAQIPDEKKRQDCQALLELFKETTGEEPVLYTGNMIGFGRYHYRYASGHEGDSFMTGFAPRKDNITLYTYAWFDERQDLLERLGKHKAGKGCVYIKRLEDIDLEVLRELVAVSVARVKETYPGEQSV